MTSVSLSKRSVISLVSELYQLIQLSNIGVAKEKYYHIVVCLRISVGSSKYMKYSYYYVILMNLNIFRKKKEIP